MKTERAESLHYSGMISYCPYFILSYPLTSLSEFGLTTRTVGDATNEHSIRLEDKDTDSDSDSEAAASSVVLSMISHGSCFTLSANGKIHTLRRFSYLLLFCYQNALVNSRMTWPLKYRMVVALYLELHDRSLLRTTYYFIECCLSARTCIQSASINLDFKLFTSSWGDLQHAKGIVLRHGLTLRSQTSWAWFLQASDLMEKLASGRTLRQYNGSWQKICDQARIF